MKKWFTILLLLLASSRQHNCLQQSLNHLLLAGDKPSNVECTDEVCNIISTSDSKGNDSSSGIINPLKGLENIGINNNNNNNNSSSNSKPVGELVKMGWKKAEAADALSKSNNDITLAASMLEEQQEREEQNAVLVKELTSLGWSDEASESAIKECSGNVTEAISLLEKEESAMGDEFVTAVKGMVENGWEEIVARQALMAQWTIDQRKSLGVNTTVDPEVLATIRPTLKKTPEEKGGLKKGNGGSASAAAGQPKPAKKEDCVFDITAANFQKIVIESPVPVILDVYADWCGPCKQLGPILESAAIKSGGMFRLCKVNSDNERAISELLEVQGLPTVYALKSGSLTDKFVGMLPQDQLQSFIVRLVTNYGEKVQPENSDEKSLSEVSTKVKNYAGLSALDFKKREKLRKLVDEALLNNEGGLQADFTLPESVATALKYIKNAGSDISNKKFRVIKTGEGSVYRDKVRTSACAVRLLEIAGFKSATNVNGTSDSIELQHYNSAVITLVLQRVTDTMQQKKFEKINKIEISVESKSMRRPAKAKNEGLYITPSGAPAATATAAAITKAKPATKVAAVASKSKSNSSSSSTGAGRKRKIARRQVTNTLLSTGITSAKKRKHEEYFGGDSTVTQAGDEDEDAEQEEEEEEESSL